MDYEEQLKRQVQDYKVCWEILPHTAFVDDQFRQIGFDLELTGTDSPRLHATPGSADCQTVYRVLKAIATYILPQEQRSSRFELSPFDDSVRYSPTHNDRPDVTLTITIEHRSGCEGVNRCEVQCLEEMKTKLRQLGAQSGAWTRATRNTA